MTIPGPTTRAPDDRARECEEALQARYDALMAEATAAGWSRDETADALIGLALQDALGSDGHRETQDAIARARRKLRNP